MKLINSLVDNKKRLIGFVVEGKDKDLDGFTDETVRKPVKVEWLMARNFRNKQVIISPKGIEQLGDFKINELPMLAIRNGEYVPVNNDLELVKRFMNNNEVIGFGLKVGGEPANYTYKNVIDLSFWYKPLNFVVRSSESGKKHIAGKPGFSINNLPTEVFGEESTAKRPKPAATTVGKVSGNIKNTFDILDIYDYVKEVNGQVLMLPSEKYKSTTATNLKTSDEFVNMGIGEIGSPVIEVGKKNLNANTLFKKPGIVNVPVAGGQVPIQTFTFTMKTIYKDGENHINRFGVMIPNENVDQFISTFSRGMAISEIKDTSVIQPFIALTGRVDVRLFEIDASKLDVISKDKLKDAVLTNAEIKKLMQQQFKAELVSKALGTRVGMLKDLKTAGVQIEEVSGRQVMGIFSAMNDEFKDNAGKAGLDLYTGAYVKKVEKDPEDTEDTSKSPKEDLPVIEIQYQLAGLDSTKITAAKIKNKDESVPGNVIKIIEQIEKIANPNERVKQINGILKKVDSELDSIKFKLWMHKVAMYEATGKNSIHSHDKGSWELNTKKRSQKVKFYNCIESDAEDLMVGLVNIDI